MDQDTKMQTGTTNLKASMGETKNPVLVLTILLMKLNDNFIPLSSYSFNEIALYL